MGKTIDASSGWSKNAQTAARPDGTANESELLRLDNQLCFAMYAASRAVIGLYRDQLDPLGLTYPQYLVLTVLWEQNNVSLTAIGRRLRLDSGTLTPLVKRLEASGLVTRDRRASDEREIEISLTEAGHALREQAVRVNNAITQRLAIEHPAAELLQSELVALVQNIDALEERRLQELRERRGRAPR